MSGLELPIGALLSLVIDQVIKTAKAVNGVLIEKEYFKTLSQYLGEIENILKELQHPHILNDCECVQQMLLFLVTDCNMADELVRKYDNCGKFYSFVFCRKIANEVQCVTRKIGTSLATLSLANSEVLYKISEKAYRLQADMQRVVFQVPQNRLLLLDRLEQIVNEQKKDSIKPSEMSRELHLLVKGKEEAVLLKHTSDEIYLNQVIDLLYHSGVPHDEEEIREHYNSLVNNIGGYALSKDFIEPEPMYICPINGSVMVNPVMLCTGSTFEKETIEAMLKEGLTSDPCNGKPLEDLNLTPNISVKQMIQSWKEQNCCLKIRRAKEILQTKSTDHSTFDAALCKLEDAIKESMICKDWIAIEGIIDFIIPLLESSGCNLKLRALQTLLQDKVVAAGGLGHIVKGLEDDSDVKMAAVNLLFELLHENKLFHHAESQEGCHWNEGFCRELKELQGTIIFLIVCISDKQYAELAKKAEEILLRLCDNDDKTIAVVASYHWYKPLVQRLSDGGPESSKVSMLKALEEMTLLDDDVKQLGKDGVISPLLKMAEGEGESKELALMILFELSSSCENKSLMVEARVVPLLTDLNFSSLPRTVIEKCAEILEKLTSSGIEFLTALEIEQIITKLVYMLQAPFTCSDIQKPTLRTILSIYKSAKTAAEKAMTTTNGVSTVLLLLDNPDNEVRELTVRLIYQFCMNKPDIIPENLLHGSRLKTLLSFLEDDNNLEMQSITSGLLAILSKSKVELTKSLVELSMLPVLLNILNNKLISAKENVLDLLSSFMDPADINMQKRVVSSEAYPVLVLILTSGSMGAKARAAALIGNLSSNSPKLTAAPPKVTGCLCFASKPVPVCKVHRGICDVKSSFCMLKANALQPLVSLFQHHDDAVTLETLRALGTLVQKGLESEGAEVLHQSKALDPMVDVLNEGVPDLLEEVVDILDKVFTFKDLADKYSLRARTPLVYLSNNKNVNENLRAKAASLLKKIQSHSQAAGSMP
ncbi:U-box domain-containing protein 44 [Apostasia shenzhenica]|uniref:RING-type E3 ubiquitin transferase n=1 Tax=Apostasia shenzhenica TaxID=1088818 RepID=A0A2I0B9C7_9ASPA|nr:U-box domain-containing protein 44 [Apostasia shenzhenica]